MSKYKFIKEYEIKASVKILYPYFSTPAGLQEWFADSVKTTIDAQTYNFHWDNEDHTGRIVSHRAGKSIKYEFLPESPEEEGDESYIEFRLDHNEITDTTFIKVIDYSKETDIEELNELWDGLIQSLKENVGG